ncbi:hypothetical protein LTR36_002271 [Oleoguttula mirabilis]|uniref:Telomerase reverse transcriptase n=1 Tax=Oleoguttula mirabilis TaxID=1507867 RepID=A0AAV9JLI0_9PEZI|nr:hypothetical protein LTR36_002271 [Oleoguttula mirabilis]
MKRKRKCSSAADANKKLKLDHADTSGATLPLLRQYYPRVLTLRHYFLTRLSKASKKRRRRVLHYGLQQQGPGEVSVDPAVTRLLDATIVGTFNQVDVSDLESIDRDITVFTQQVSDDSTTTISPTQGALKQSEIVDFVVWQLFRRNPGNRKPAHILCHGYQRTANNGAELEIVAGIPGIYSSCHNSHVQTLKEQPWTALPAILGSGAERIICDLLLDCCTFIPVGQSSNLNQLSGTPMCELKPLKPQPRVQQDIVGSEDVAEGTTSEACKDRGSSSIRFVRHRMLYARPSLTTKGKPRFGLAHSHVLDRLQMADDVSETKHVMKYIFPRQFGLHNVFASDIDPKETAQPFKDYAAREKEIIRSELRQRSKRGGKNQLQLQAKASHLPRRLRGKPFELVQRIRKRHARCAYHALLQHHCPPRQNADVVAHGSTHYASSTAEVSAFCRAAISKIFPSELWGSGDVAHANSSIVLQSIDRFVRLRRYESMTLHDVLQPMKIRGAQWLAAPNTDPTAKLSNTDFAKRKELMAELLYYLFDSFLIPLIRGTFHVTESNVHRNQLFYFRHDVWKAMSEPALTLLKDTMLEECNAVTVKKMLATRALGVSHVRLLPKEQGMRPIINLRRRVQKLQRGELVLGRSTNSVLTPAFSVLNYEKNANPHMLGSALFSVDDIFPRLQAFRQSLCEQGHGSAPLYFAKVDVQSCFDTIPQKRLMTLAKTVLGADKYSVARFARAKLLGGHDEGTPGFGMKPCWKFLTKATGDDKPFSFDIEAENDTAEGRSRTVYVDGVLQKGERRATILGLLEEHIEHNLIRVGKRFYRQKEGIPQGSIVSSLLCSFMYAELERVVLGFLQDGQSLLLRLIDDFLVVSTKREVAERFMRVMHGGVPEFGVRVKAEKSRANFDIEIQGERIARLSESAEFPYCGNAINTVTLDISKDHERRRNSNLADAVTVEYSKLPGQTFYRKTLNALKLQMHAMLLSTNYNSLQTVLSNLYHSFSEVAQKTHHYMRSLPSEKQPGDALVINAY